MQLVSAQDGVLRSLDVGELADRWAAGFVTGLAAIDALLPGGRLASGAVHEILTEPGQGLPRFFALLLARRAAGRGVVVWADPKKELYPPALARAGLPLERLFLLRIEKPQEELWAVAECLRCKAVAATVVAPPRLSRIQARRLQLAAEHGGGVGIFLRHTGAASAQYAAATRWLVRPMRGGKTVQRWNIQLIHGHGGQVGRSVCLEVCRDTNRVRAQEHPVRAAEALAGGSGPAESARASA